MRLLLYPDKACLMREPDNGPTRLLCVAVWVKLNRLFFNKGTQNEAAMMFHVSEKQLSRLLMGWKY